MGDRRYQGGGNDGYRPFAPLSEEYLKRKPLPKDMQDYNDEDDDWELTNDTITKTAGATSSGSACRSMLEISTRSPFEPFNLKIGEESERFLRFCPFKVVQRYPHMYVGRNNQDEVAGFFKEELLLNRVWDFFYLLDPSKNRRDPMLLVPTVQFQQFLNVANQVLKRNLAIPGGAKNKFSVIFDETDTVVPRFLGRANSLDALEALKNRIVHLPNDLTRLASVTLEDYAEKMDKMYSSCRPPKKNPEVARVKRMQRQKGYGRMVKRVQRYLGLRDRAVYASPSSASASTWNVNMLAPVKPKDSVRFVSVDVEAYERNTNLITEIGFAVLDTEDTMDIPPGKNGQNWFNLITTYHYRIDEHSYMVNRDFVRGCPDSFDFGKTEFVSLNQINKYIGRIIGDHDSEDKRPVIVVGHDIVADFKYLKAVGYNVWRVPQVFDEADTKSMFQYLRRDSNGRGLQMVCDALETPGRNFHNAGNDAVYTLRAMIAMVIKRKVQGPYKSEQPKAEGTNDEEWTDGEMDDGGAPHKTPEPVDQIQASRPPQEPQW